MAGLSRAVLIDRDGTINARPAPHRYVERADDLIILPGAARTIARLTRLAPVVVVSNQRGVARGLVSWATLQSIEAAIQEAVRAHGGAPITAFRYCPHGHDEGCRCRKPLPGLLLDAADLLGVPIARCVMVGDSAADRTAAAAAGCPFVRVNPYRGVAQAEAALRTELSAASAR